MTLLLPRSSPSRLHRVRRTSSRLSAAQRGQRGQVLLVEDDKEVAALTREMLTASDSR